MFRKIGRFLRSSVPATVGVYAANAAFFVLLSLFPAMMLLIALLQYTPLTPTDLQLALSGFIPDALSPLLDYMTQELFAANSVGLISLTAVFAVWSSSRGVYSLICGLNQVCGIRETRTRLILRLRSAMDTVLLLFALIVTLILHLFGTTLSSRLRERGLTVIASLLEMKYLFSFTALTVLFAVFYLRFPNRQLQIADVLPGAFGTAICWIGFSSLFTFYISHTGNYSLYYGSLSVIAMTMLWLYVCMCIFFYGGLLNHLLAARKGK